MPLCRQDFRSPGRQYRDGKGWKAIDGIVHLPIHPDRFRRFGILFEESQIPFQWYQLLYL